MKRSIVYGLAIALLASCSTKELDTQKPFQDEVTFFASFEQPDEAGTRVFANEELLLRWNADDRVSIFNKNTYNQQYKFTGDTGDNAGGFDKVEGAEFTTGNAIPHVVSVYPYRESTEISESETITVSLSAEQHYAENTFGLGANPMVSVTSDNFLLFKNVGGYLRLSLYGDGVSVSSITLKGNNGEKLAGKATVTMPLDGTPTIALAHDAAEEITLVCDTPVALGATFEESVDFWFVVPPVTFSKGFQVKVFCDNGMFEKTTSRTVTIERNHLSKMASIEVEISQLNNIIYYTSSDGTVVAPNNPDAFGANIVSNEYVDGHGVVTFDGDVTYIGNNAFSGCSNLTGITIPDGVTSIGDRAFQYCSSLTSITIPDSVTSIGEATFSGCSSLTSITIPEGVTSIGGCAFYGCSSLTSITIPEGVTSIGDGVFANCSSLMTLRGKFSSPDGLFLIDSNMVLIAVASGAIKGEVTIPETVTRIGSYVFQGCIGLTHITIPEGVTSIGDGVFLRCTSLTKITIPEGVTTIGTNSFNNCTSLTSITIPESVTIIGNGAFLSCTSLTSITIPESVTIIGIDAFYSCYGLTSITIPEGVTIIGDSAFLNCTSLTSITIPEGVTSIGSSVFQYCTSLTSITIPERVTSIGEHAFQGCTSLTSITIPEGVTSIGNYAFWGCTSLPSITIPESVTIIGNGAFSSCYGLTSITIKPVVPPTGRSSMFDLYSDCPIYVPAVSVEAYKNAQYWSDYADRIQSISQPDPQPNNVIYYTSSDGTIVTPKDVFDASIVSNEYSDGLGIITFDRDVRSVGEAAFSQCQRLTSINLPANVRSIGRSAFSYCTSLANITTPEGLTSIGSFAFGGCSSLSSITMPESVIGIGDHAFSGCSSLSSITIPESVTSIMEETFRGCSSLLSFNGKYASSDGLFLIDQGVLVATALGAMNGSISIPNNVSKIGLCAFENCTNLTSITIPDSVTRIGKYAFYDCSNLREITISNSVTNIEPFAFFGCSSITEFAIPNTVKVISDSAFYDCTNLAQITIPTSVNSIGRSAFERCDNLASIIVLPSTPPSGADSMFEMISNVCPIYVPAGSVDVYKAAQYWSDYADRIKANPDSDSIVSITLSEAGALIEELSSSQISSLEAIRLIGNINGTDLVVIRRMPKLHTLDLSQATIVSGGREYYGSYTTEDNKIGPYTFFNLPNLKQVILPDSIIEIGDNAFNGTPLDSINLPDGITYIGTGSLYGSHFEKLILPSALTTIGSQAFCQIQLEDSEVTIPETVESIGSLGFEGPAVFHIKASPTVLKEIGLFALGTMYSSIVVYVPAGTKSEYFFTEIGNYTNLFEE